ncbi:MAG: hypothetical protein JWM64_1986 [Frankiales bacterium]|nr:hypothetical protein [Frankiales bacterium]
MSDPVKDLLVRLADDLADGVVAPPLRAPRRAHPWAAPLAAAAAVVGVPVGSVSLVHLRDDAVTRPAVEQPSPTALPPSDLDRLYDCPGPRGVPSDTPDGLPSYVEQRYSVRAGEPVRIPWRMAGAGTATLSQVLPSPRTVLRQSRERGTDAVFELHPTVALKLELGGRLDDGTVCQPVEIEVVVDGEDTRALHVASRDGRRYVFTGHVQVSGAQQAGVYVLHGWGSGGPVEYELLGDLDVQPDGSYRLEHVFDAPGSYLVAAKTGLGEVEPSLMSEPVRLEVE